MIKHGSGAIRLCVLGSLCCQCGSEETRKERVKQTECFFIFFHRKKTSLFDTHRISMNCKKCNISKNVS
jgi:hypothetical protein